MELLRLWVCVQIATFGGMYCHKLWVNGSNTSELMLVAVNAAAIGSYYLIKKFI